MMTTLAPRLCGQSQTGRTEVRPQQRMGANDLIAVAIYNAEELSLQARIAEDGLLRLPMLATPLPAMGMMPEELERAIAAGYVKEGILVNPVVTVSVLEYASKPVSVIGAVKQPLTFHADQPISLLEAVTRAGGFTDEAGSFLLLSAKVSGPDEEAVLTQRIPISDLLESGSATAGISVRGGEEIRVPEAGKIFVVGNVKKPGSFRIPNDHETSVLKALAMSEGLLPNATKEAYIYRKASDGSKAEIPINLKNLMARKAADITLLRDDVLYIPESGRRKATLTAMEKALAFGSATASGMLIWGVARR
ncbi:MAG: SLBB domain-containing protein [Bryobacterales bacterium]|nr:SLBB domain-containing protein [Bryobacterales bacterium]